MFKLASPELLFDKLPVYRVLTSKSATSADLHKVIIVYQNEVKELPAGVKEMLEKLVVACKYKPEDVVYIDVSQTPDTSLGGIKAKYAPEVVLSFGDVVLSRNLPALKRNMPIVLNGMKVIHAEALDKLQANPKEKAALWGGLQKMMTL